MKVVQNLLGNFLGRRYRLFGVYLPVVWSAGAGASFFGVYIVTRFLESNYQRCKVVVFFFFFFFRALTTLLSLFPYFFQGEKHGVFSRVLTQSTFSLWSKRRVVCIGRGDLAQ